MAEKIRDGITKHPLYMTWANIKTRCYNKNSPDYPNWGGRGITMCDEWLHDPAKFIDDMYPKYKKGLTLDRIDVNGNYSPDNCRWVDMRTQQNNRTNNNLLEYNGKKMTISAWARELNIKRSTISQRYYTYKWSIERCLGGY